MADFSVVVSDPQAGRAYQLKVSGNEANKLIGKIIGERIPGAIIGLKGYQLLITGGSDKDGFPMRRDLPGAARKKIMTAENLGHHPAEKGQRRRKTMRGREISSDVIQINVKVSEYGAGSIPKLLGLEIEEEAKPEPEAEVAEKEEVEPEAVEVEEEAKPEPEEPEVAGTIEDIPVGEGIINKLKDAGYDTLEKLSQAGADELRGVKGVGDKTVEKIFSYLGRNT